MTEGRLRIHDAYELTRSCAEVGEETAAAVLRGDGVLRCVGWEGDVAREVEVALRSVIVDPALCIVTGSTPDERVVNIHLVPGEAPHLTVATRTRAEWLQLVADGKVRHVAAPLSESPAPEAVPVWAYPVRDDLADLVTRLGRIIGGEASRELAVGVVVDDEPSQVELTLSTVVWEADALVLTGWCGGADAHVDVDDEPWLVTAAPLVAED